MKKPLLALVFLGLLLGGGFFFSSQCKPIGESLKIPLYFFWFTDAAVVQVEIEGRYYAMEIDTGADGWGSLQESALKAVGQKEYKQMIKFFDVKGNVYEVPEYLIPSMKIGHLKVENGIINQEHINFLRYSASFWKISPNRIKTQLKEVQGSIGRDFLRQFNCFLDFPHAALYLTENFQETERAHKFKNFISYPFELTDIGIIFVVETDLGLKRFVLDSDSSFSVIKSDARSTWTTHQLIIGNQDYGKWKFWPLEFGDVLKDVDGILGVDFFRQYAIDIDFENRVAYVEPPHGFMLRVWRDVCNWWYCL
jgi:hypothetical protein